MTLGFHDVLDLGLASVTGAGQRVGVPKGIKWGAGILAIGGAVGALAMAWKEGDVTHVPPPPPDRGGAEGWKREVMLAEAVALENEIRRMRERPGGVPGHPGIAGQERRRFQRMQAELAALLAKLGIG